MATDKNDKHVSRRGFLGTGLFLPFLSDAQKATAKQSDQQDDEFATMLTAKGGVVRVRKSALSKAKVVEKNLSNKSLFSWLKLNDNK